MRSVERYIDRGKKRGVKYAKGYETGYDASGFSVMLRQARKSAGITQETVAKKLGTNKSAISRIENHSQDIRLSTLGKFAKALGKKLKVVLSD